uniref:UPF0489 protein C5orf22-like protein n=1 Tax=Magallana gigas TaxID=29159 RepID=K1R958_MAGGI
MAAPMEHRREVNKNAKKSLVLPYIHRAIGSHHLPFSNLVFVHFDSHPDMLIPKDMPADETFNKEILYENISIENWIMPMIYAGHISVILWVKPPWCSQIEDKNIHFYVGKCVTTGTLRCSCKESYFVSETLYRPESQLTNKKLVQLVVFTLRPNGWREESGLYKSAEDTQQEHKGNVRKGNAKEAVNKGQINKSSKVQEKLAGGETDSEQNKNNVDECVMGNSVNEKTNNTCVKCGGLHGTVILDIDLDFYSTKNPFLEVFTPSQYKILQELYRFQAPTSNSDEDIEACVVKREKELNHLKQEFLKFSQCSEPLLSHPKANQIKALVEDLQSCQTEGGDAVNFDLLHEAGCTCDDTELPHHVSNQEQMNLLVDATQEFLSHLKRPTIITMARSSQDDYCPPDQVESIQNSVLEILQDLYLEIELTVDYE